MTTGMMWLITDTKKSFEEALEGAIKYFSEKYFVLPDLIQVSRSDVDKKYLYGKIEIVPDKDIGKGNLFLVNKVMSNKIENGDGESYE